MTWLKKQEACTLESSTLRELLEYHQRAMWEALKLYGHHKNIMLALVTAVFAGAVALLSTSTQALLWMSLFMPAAVSTTCFFAKKSLDRYYQLFLEAIVCIAKVEYMLGLHCPVWPKELPPGFYEMVQRGEYPFRDDPTIDVDRRWRSRLASGSVNSTTWIKQHMSRGHNGVVEKFMGALFSFSLFVPVGALLRVADLKPSSSPALLWNTLCANWFFCGLVLFSLFVSGWLYYRQCRWITLGRRTEQSSADKQGPNQ